MNKIIMGIAAALVISTTFSAFSFYRDNQKQQSQLAGYKNQVAQLLTHVESNTEQRLKFENQIEQLNDELRLRDNRVKTLSSNLEELAQKIDPDFEQIERDLRRQISNEIRRESQADETPAPARIVRQLAEMNPEDRMAIMSVQGRYSGFLEALNTSPERKELITQALIDVSLEQTSARQELMRRARQELATDRNPQQLQAEMQRIMGPQATREALSFELTDDELALFDQLQATQTMGFTTTINNDGSQVRIMSGGRSDALLVNPDAAGPVGQQIFIQQLQPGIPPPQQ